MRIKSEVFDIYGNLLPANQSKEQLNRTSHGRWCVFLR